jgi:hypothetical protein
MQKFRRIWRFGLPFLRPELLGRNGAFAQMARRKGLEAKTP